MTDTPNTGLTPEQEAARVPAEVWHVGTYIAGEMEARGWSARDLAERMGGAEPVPFNEALIELICGEQYMLPNDAECELDPDTAEKLSRAFGTSAALWINLDATYQKAGPTTIRHRHRDEPGPQARGPLR